MTEETKVGNPYAQVEGVLLYTTIQKPTKAYQNPGTASKPDEWKVSVALTDEDYVDDLEEWAAKNDIKLSLKKIKNSAFEGLYKIPPPEDAGKNIWVWTLRKSTEQGKTGNPIPPKFQPKVYQRKGDTLLDVTNNILVGNGSKGIVSTDLFVRNNGSASIYLKNVLVKELVEYVSSSADSYVEGSEFGIPVEQTKESTEEKKPAKVTKKPAVSPEDELDDDLPF